MGRFIFLGAPGAGKGTQAKVLADMSRIPHVSTGDILRESVARRTALGLQAKDYMDRGDLVPDQLVIDLIKERLTQPDAKTGWILDGFPRNVTQATFLDNLLKDIDQEYDYAVNFTVPDEILISRMLNRGRKDDTEEVIRHRLQIYHEKTAPLIDFYQDREKLISIDGSVPVEDVTAQLKQLV